MQLPLLVFEEYVDKFQQKVAKMQKQGLRPKRLKSRSSKEEEYTLPPIDDEDDDTDRTWDYANHFFDAFKDRSLFTRRDVDFMYELAENTTRLILDENLNEDSLAAQV